MRPPGGTSRDSLALPLSLLSSKPNPPPCSSALSAAGDFPPGEASARHAPHPVCHTCCLSARLIRRSQVFLGCELPEDRGSVCLVHTLAAGSAQHTVGAWEKTEGLHAGCRDHPVPCPCRSAWCSEVQARRSGEAGRVWTVGPVEGLGL